MTDLNDTTTRKTSSSTLPPSTIPEHLSSFTKLYTYMTTPTSTNPNPYPVLPPKSPHALDSSLTHIITLHSFHPVLESLLHILNRDLSSAHFLLRHMECAPAYEAMYLHGILHRVEGDYRNAEAWYGNVADVGSDVFRAVWGGQIRRQDGDEAEYATSNTPDQTALESSKSFIRRVEILRKSGEGSLEELEWESKRELDLFMKFVRDKFGTEKVEDATQVWIKRSEEQRQKASNMVVGGEGWRTF